MELNSNGNCKLLEDPDLIFKGEFTDAGIIYF